MVPAAPVFTPLLDDIYELTSKAPTPIDLAHRRRLAPEAVVNLDWHNDMSKLVLDINDAMEAAADDRARGVIIRRLRRALGRRTRSSGRGLSRERQTHLVGEFVADEGLADDLHFVHVFSTARSAKPVTNSIGSRGRLSRTRRASSAPLMPGIATSMMMRSIAGSPSITFQRGAAAAASMTS